MSLSEVERFKEVQDMYRQQISIAVLLSLVAAMSLQTVSSATIRTATQCSARVQSNTPSEGQVPPALQRSNDNYHQMAAALRHNDVKQVKRLLTAGYTLKEFDKYDSALILALVNRCDVKMLRLLLDGGENLHKVRFLGGYWITPLMAAAAYDTIQTTQYLIDKGANVNARISIGENVRNAMGQTVLIYTATHRYTDSVLFLRLLLKHKAKVNAQDQDGTTALMAAAGHTSAAALELLMAYGARVSDTDKQGQTALMLAAEGSDVSEVACLLRHHADVNAADLDGRTPLMYVAGTYKATPAMVAFLLQHGAEVNAMDHEGRTSLKYTTFPQPEGLRIDPRVIELLIKAGGV